MLDNTDSWIISSAMSVLSFISMLASCYGAYRSFCYKKEINDKLASWGIKEYYLHFVLLGQEFVNRTRAQKWFKGINPGTVINPLSDLLCGFGKVSVYIEDEAKRGSLQNMVTALHTRIQRYEYEEEQLMEDKEETNKLIVRIALELGTESTRRMAA